MYVPASFAVSDEKILRAFIERYDFATLIISSPVGLVAIFVVGALIIRRVLMARDAMHLHASKSAAR